MKVLSAALALVVIALGILLWLSDSGRRHLKADLAQCQEDWLDAKEEAEKARQAQTWRRYKRLAAAWKWLVEERNDKAMFPPAEFEGRMKELSEARHLNKGLAFERDLLKEWDGAAANWIEAAKAFRQGDEGDAHAFILRAEEFEARARALEEKMGQK